MNHTNFRSFWLRRLLFFFIALLAWAVVVWLLWNALLPDLFDFPTLNYFQALGLLLLTRILFGNLPFSNTPSRRNHWKEKWMKMSPEERAEMAERWRQKKQARRERNG